VRLLYHTMKGGISSTPCSDDVRIIWDEKLSKHTNLYVWVTGRARDHMHLGVPHKTGLSSWNV